MRIKCEYCESFIDDTEEKCPYCGATNNSLARSGKGIPKTINELKDFANSHNLPLEEMHYYLGENYLGPKAIGIYKDEDLENFIVYKNKSDGTRSVRYEGKDEAYAVNEIYQKMHTDVMNQKARNIANSSSSSRPSYSMPDSSNRGIFGGLKKIFMYILTVIVILTIFGGGCAACILDSGSSAGSYSNPSSGYSQDYDYDYGYGSSESGSSWWNSDDEDSDSWWNSDDSWDSSDWDWDSGSSWDSGDSDWDSDW